MANGFHVSGTGSLDACFYLSFRDNPFGAGFSVTCGLEQAIEYVEHLTFSDEDVAFLGAQTGNDGAPIFDPTFLDRLRAFEFECDVDAVPEGTVVFPGEPIVSVTGPIICAQLVETALLNIINFQTLIATKAARVVHAAGGDPVVEFGLRRAQGPDGGLSASRAAYVGGCAGTSNTLAAREYGIPAAGTHAHSWVMVFDGRAGGVRGLRRGDAEQLHLPRRHLRHARGVRACGAGGGRLRERGHEMVGIRIDSGDLALALDARPRDPRRGRASPMRRSSRATSSTSTSSRASRTRAPRIDVWGVGTKLVTAYDQPALGGVYKLSAIRAPAASGSRASRSPSRPPR